MARLPRFVALVQLLTKWQSNALSMLDSQNYPVTARIQRSILIMYSLLGNRCAQSMRLHKITHEN